MNKPVLQVDRVRAASSRLGDGARTFDFPGCTTVKLSRISRNRAPDVAQPRPGAPGTHGMGLCWHRNQAPARHK